MKANTNEKQKWGNGSLRALLIIIFLFGVYTNLTIEVFGRPYYGYISAVAAVFLLMISKGGIVRSKMVVQSFLVLFFTLVFSSFFSTGGPTVNKVVSSGLLVSSILFSSVLFSELRRLSSSHLYNLFFILVALVAVLLVMEVYLGMRGVFDKVREALYSSEGLFLYESTERDVALHGAIRANGLTQEPSHPAKFLSVLLACMYFLARRNSQRIIVFGIFLVISYLVKSPSVIVFPALILCKRLFFENPAGLKSFAVLVVLLAVVFSAPSWVSMLPFERAKAISNGQDASSIMRTVGPAMVTAEVLSKNPFFGFGVGGDDSGGGALLEVYSKFSSVNVDGLYDDSSHGWGNAFFLMVSSVGLLGLAALLLTLMHHLKVLGGAAGSFAISSFVILLSVDGAFAILRPWAYSFMVVAVLSIHERELKEVSD